MNLNSLHLLTQSLRRPQIIATLQRRSWLKEGYQLVLGCQRQWEQRQVPKPRSPRKPLHQAHYPFHLFGNQNEQPFFDAPYAQPGSLIALSYLRSESQLVTSGPFSLPAIDSKMPRRANFGHWCQGTGFCKFHLCCWSFAFRPEGSDLCTGSDTFSSEAIQSQRTPGHPRKTGVTENTGCLFP